MMYPSRAQDPFRRLVFPSLFWLFVATLGGCGKPSTNFSPDSVRDNGGATSKSEGAPRSDAGHAGQSTPEVSSSNAGDNSSVNEQSTTLTTGPDFQQLQEVILPDATFPLTLRELSDPRERSAHVRVHFSVIDSEGRAISDLRASDFRIRENDRQLDSNESALTIGRSSDPIFAPVVLLLDLSRSVVKSGILERIVEAANTVIDALVPEQELSILVFADEARTLSNFTANKDTHRSAVAALVGQEGNSTNLFGALIEAYSLWQNGVSRPSVPDAGINPPAGAFSPPLEIQNPPLVVGMLIVVSDGNDTAGVATLDEVLEARGNKKTLFLRAGPNLKLLTAQQLATIGVLDVAENVSALREELNATLLRASQLDEALYVAEYCSPKRAGSHQLSLSIEANTTFLKENPVSGCQVNLSDASEDFLCPGTTGISCSNTGGASVCCPATAPFACPSLKLCRETAEEAAATCRASCTRCDRVLANFDPEDALVDVEFVADDFSSNQCNALFEAVDSAPPEIPRPSAASAPDAGLGDAGRHDAAPPEPSLSATVRGASSP